MVTLEALAVTLILSVWLQSWWCCLDLLLLSLKAIPLKQFHVLVDSVGQKFGWFLSRVVCLLVHKPGVWAEKTQRLGVTQCWGLEPSES